VADPLLDHRQQVGAIAPGAVPSDVAQVDTQISAEQGQTDEQARAGRGDQACGPISEMRTQGYSSRSQDHDRRVTTATVERALAVADLIIDANTRPGRLTKT
jgi:hypothetical protein